MTELPTADSRQRYYLVAGIVGYASMLWYLFGTIIKTYQDGGTPAATQWAIMIGLAAISFVLVWRGILSFERRLSAFLLHKTGELRKNVRRR